MRHPKEIKQCIRCGLVFGLQYCCPKCHVELQRAYLAEPMRQMKEGNICQFCLVEIAELTNAEVSREKKKWFLFDHTGNTPSRER